MNSWKPLSGDVFISFKIFFVMWGSLEFALEHAGIAEWEDAFTTAPHSCPVELNLWGKGLSVSRCTPKQITDST